MRLIVYGDFNCPYSCLASARVDRLLADASADVEWRAVEHDPTIPRPSAKVEGEVEAMFDRELAEVTAQLAHGEEFPIGRPPVRPNTRAAIAAFASASGTAAHALRRRLFAAYWCEGRDIADPSELDALGAAACRGGYERAARWRAEWLGLERTVVPMLVLPDGYASRGLGALARLGKFADEGRKEETR